MRKALLLVVVLALALGITYLLLHKSGSGTEPQQKDPALSVKSNSSAFNRSFSGVLDTYYVLADKLRGGDTLQIGNAGVQLKRAIDSIRFDQFKADSSVVETAVSLAQSLPGEIDGLRGEQVFEQKKREFNMITEDLYSLIRVVKYDGGTIYHMSCATAFRDSTEGFWLSPDNAIHNPYTGNNNSACGEVKDSLHFTAGNGE